MMVKSQAYGSDSGEDRYSDEFERYEEVAEEIVEQATPMKGYDPKPGLHMFDVLDARNLQTIQKRPQHPYQPRSMLETATPSPQYRPSVMLRPLSVPTLPPSENPFPPPPVPENDSGVTGAGPNAEPKKTKKKKKKDKGQGQVGQLEPEVAENGFDASPSTELPVKSKKKKKSQSIVAVDAPAPPRPVPSFEPYVEGVKRESPPKAPLMLDSRGLPSDDDVENLKNLKRRTKKPSRAVDLASLRASTESSVSALSGASPTNRSNGSGRRISHSLYADVIPGVSISGTKNARASPTQPHDLCAPIPAHLPTQMHAKPNGVVDPFAKRPVLQAQPVLPHHNSGFAPAPMPKSSSPICTKPPTPPSRRTTPPQRLDALSCKPNYQTQKPPPPKLPGPTPAASGEPEELCVSDCSDFEGDLADVHANPVKIPKQPQFAESSLTLGVIRSRSLRQLILGNTVHFPRAWEEQGFFPNPSIPYGIMQNEGGPCGVLAAVQGFILRFLIHEEVSKSFDEALARTLASICWQAAQQSDEKHAYVCLPPAGAGLTNGASSSSMENFRLFTFSDFDALLHFVESKLQVYQVPKGIGVILLVVSAVLSRGGVAHTRGDMDLQDTSLIVEHGYCAQELVNLLMVGMATSNVFDGVQVLSDVAGGSKDEATMKGIPYRGEIGFLTYYEHFDYFTVGAHLKVCALDISKHDTWHLVACLHCSL